MFAAPAVVRLGSVEVRLEICEGQPVTGRVHATWCEPVPFTGWLALLVVLEQLVSAGGPQPPAGGVSGSQPPAGGLGGQFHPRGQAQFPQGMGDVGMDGVAGDEQPGGDIAVGPPLGDQPDHP
jgi:hypothetical protein